MAIPKHPSLFVRFPGSQVGHLEPTVLPWASEHYDYEAELALVIGKEGRHIPTGDAMAHVAGYACFGPIACTTASYDLFWIAVHPDFQGRGLGRRLLSQAERLIREAGGRRIYVETSQRAQYDSTRAFYESTGYRLESVLPDFYAPGDGKAVYCKVLPA